MSKAVRTLGLCWCGLVIGSGLATAQEWSTDTDPVVQPTEYQHLVERLSELEAEVSALKAPAPIQPANAEYLPPAPTELGALTYGYTQATAPAAAPAKPKYPMVTVNGVFQADTVYFHQDELNRLQLGDIQDGADIRRTRLSASGAVAENVNYFVQMDFGFFGRPTFTDVWGEIKEVPWLGTVRIGQWKQPYSLEVPTSFRYQTFMERSVLFQTFDAFRHLGIGFYNNSEDEDWTWALSGFRVGQDQFANDIGDAGGWSTAGRFTHLLWYNDYKDADKRLEYLHLGGAFWFGDPGNDSFRYATIPEMFVGAFGVPAGTVPGTSKVQVPSISNGTPPFVDTGTFATNTFTHVGGEMLWAHGPFSWQSEVQMAHVEQPGGPALQFWGFYTEVMYFLTGESKPYLRKLGQIDRIQPLRPFLREGDCDRGPGAWEVAYRVSYIDLNDQNIMGGKLADITAGLNWYLNGYTKFQFNYVHAALNRNFNGVNDPNTADIFGARFQVDF
jgi:phosphate-selective porin OprO/OprP